MSQWANQNEELLKPGNIIGPLSDCNTVKDK